MSELMHVLNWMLWISGTLLWIAVPGYWALNHMCSKIEEVNTRSIDDDGYLSYPAEVDLSRKTTAELLDQTLDPHAKLNTIYRVLCQRAGVVPNSLCPMADLISEAVFDGQRREQCIYELDLIESSVCPVSIPLQRNQHHA